MTDERRILDHNERPFESEPSGGQRVGALVQKAKTHSKAILVAAVAITGLLAALIANSAAIINFVTGKKPTTPVTETEQHKAIAAFETANTAYYEDATWFIAKNIEATEKKQSEEESTRWDKHADDKELGSYYQAKLAMNRLNTVFNGRLAADKKNWQTAVDAIYDLNNYTYTSRGSNTWSAKCPQEYVGTEKPNKEDFLKSPMYLVPTQTFKDMIESVAATARTIMSGS